MTASAESLRDHFSDTPPDPLNWADLPTTAPRRPRANLSDPIHVGAIDAAQRGVVGPIALEVEIDLGRPSQVHLGPFVMAASEAARLGQLLTIAAGLFGEVARPLNPTR